MRGDAVEDVVRTSAGSSSHVGAVRVARDRRALQRVEAPQLVEPEDVIGVAVREEDRVDARDAVAQRLLPKIGRRVDEDARAYPGTSM